MLTGVDYIRHICSERKLPISQIEKDLNFSNGYFNPKKLKRIPYERAVAVANYLNVPLDPILGINESDTPSAVETQVASKAEEILKKLNIDKMDDKQLEMLTKYAEFLVSQSTEE